MATRNLRSAAPGPAQSKPLEVAQHWAKQDTDPPWYSVQNFGDKGRGVVTKKSFFKNDFLLHYAGDIILAEEGERREKQNSSGYRFFFKSKGKKLCVDATDESKRLGRLVNHGEKKERNCKMKEVDGFLFLFCTRDIEEEEELLYDYGLTRYPWKKAKNEMPVDKAHETAVAKTPEREPVVMISCCSDTEKAKNEMPVDKEHETAVAKTPEREPVVMISCCSDTEKAKNEMPVDKEHETAVAKTLEREPVVMISCCSDTEKAKNEMPVDKEHETAVAKTPEREPVVMISCCSDTEKAKNEMHVDKAHETAVAKTPERELVVMVSCCSDTEKERIQEVAKSLKIQICHEFNPSVTHLLMKNDPTNDRKCERTWKYFVAVANKLWILNTNWLEKSAEEGFLLPEIDYEINTDTVTNFIHNGPQKSRTSHSLLLADYSFVLSGFCGNGKVSYGDLEALITRCGGSVVESFQFISRNNIVIAAEDEQHSFVKHVSSKCVTVGVEWLLDTLTTYSIQPYDDYIVEQNLSGSIDGFDMEDVEEDHTALYEDDDDTEDKMDEDKDYTPDADCGSNSMLVDTDNEDEYLPTDSDVNETEIVSDSEEEVDDCSTVFGTTLKTSTGIQVQQSKNEGKREQKLQSCVFCETVMTKVSRHMQRKHQNEKEVAKILLLQKKSKERKQAWQALISKGNYNHNVTVLKQGKGTIIPKYRPRKGDDKEKNDYLPCSNCFAFIVTTDLWKHQKSCPVTNKVSHYKGETIYDGKLLIPPTCTTSRKLHENVILKMRDDVISSFVRTDNLILEFGERCYEKLGHHLQNHQYIAQRMRELARLVIATKDIKSTITKLAQCVEPENWVTLLQGVKKVSGFNEEKGKYDVPSLALKLGHSLSKCARIVRNQGAIEQNVLKQQKAESFLNLYKDEWNDRISSLALETLHVAKFNKPKLLPTVEDVSRLHNHLQKEAESLVNAKDAAKYTELAEICLVQIILFNRKRSGEAERIQLDQYRALKSSSEIDIEIAKSLTKFERALIENHKRIEIRGKKGSKVPILFTNDMVRNVNCLLELRKTLQIHSEYLFAKPGSRFPIRGTDAMRKLAGYCGSQLPELLKSTNLRKQLATMSQLLNLNSNDQDLLAKFMGHDLQIHKEYYRIPQSTLEIAKVSKVLHAINEGKIADMKDQSLDEIQLEDEELEVECGSGQSSDEENDHNNGSSSIKVKDVDNDNADFWSSDDLEDNDITLKGSLKRKKTKTPVVKKAWTEKEKLAVEKTLGKHLKLKTLPGKTECLTAMYKEPALKNRKWEHIKHYIRNRNIPKKYK